MSTEIFSQLSKIRDQLDAAHQHLCAAHVQMAIDKLARPDGGVETTKCGR